MKKLFLPALGLFIVSQLIMLYLAVINLSGSGARGYVSGPMAHFMGLFISSFLLVFALKQIEFKNPYAFSILYSIIAAVLIEFVQLALPYRTFGVDDMFFGILGGIAFAVLGHGSEHGYRHIKSKRDAKPEEE